MVYYSRSADEPPKAASYDVVSNLLAEPIEQLEHVSEGVDARDALTVEAQIGDARNIERFDGYLESQVFGARHKARTIAARLIPYRDVEANKFSTRDLEQVDQVRVGPDRDRNVDRPAPHVQIDVEVFEAELSGRSKDGLLGDQALKSTHRTVVATMPSGTGGP